MGGWKSTAGGEVAGAPAREGSAGAGADVFAALAVGGLGGISQFLLHCVVGGSACSTSSPSEPPSPPLRVGSGRLAGSLSFSAAASGCWLWGAASKSMPRTAVPGTAAIVAAQGRGVVSPAGSWLLIVSLSSALATCKATTRENTSPRLSRLCSACSPLRSYTSSSCSLGSALSTARCVRLAFCCSHAQSSSSSSAAAAPVVLIGVLCSFSPGVKVVALVRSSAEARTSLCALLRMLRLAGITGTVGCGERATDGARVVPFAARGQRAGGAATKVVVSTAGHKFTLQASKQHSRPSFN